jgi:hypothetical protein
MEIIQNSKKISIERREFDSDWKPVEYSFPSIEAASARIDYLRSVAGTELYRIAQTVTSIYNY